MMWWQYRPLKILKVIKIHIKKSIMREFTLVENIAKWDCGLISSFRKI